MGTRQVQALAVALAAAWTAGCTTPGKLTPRRPRAHLVGTETVKTLGQERFLECVEPESKEMFERKLQRSHLDRPLYYSDKAERDNPVSLQIPAVFTLSLEAFREVEKQGYQGPPRIKVQARERTKVLQAKVYHVTTSLYGEDDELVKKKQETETFPRYYDWNWHPACKVLGEREVRVEIRALEEASGLPYTARGLLDRQGMISFELTPYLEAGASRAEGLGFLFSSPAEGLHMEVRVPQEVFAAYARRPGGRR